MMPANWSALLLYLRSAVLAVLLAALTAPLASTAEGRLTVISNETATVFQRVPDIENQLYGHAYPEQPLSRRIARIERTLFGAPLRGSSEMRMQQIEARVNNFNSQQSLAEQEPLIQYLEEKLFQRTFSEKPLPERIKQLEVQVFGRSFEEYPTAIRMKKLTYAMPILAREIRLTNQSDGMVIATTSRTSQRVLHGMRPKADPGREVVELDALGNNAVRKLPDSTAAVGLGDFFQSIHRTDDGDMLRWSHLPVHVYVKTSDALNEALTVQVITAWQNAFPLQMVDSESKADIILSWDRADWDASQPGLSIRPVVRLSDAKTLRTVVLAGLYPVAGRPAPLRQHAVSHALGHAAGLWGHSDDPGDIMYPALNEEMADYPVRWRWRSASAMNHISPVGTPSDYQPSGRDINTLMRVYDQAALDLAGYHPY